MGITLSGYPMPSPPPGDNRILVTIDGKPTWVYASEAFPEVDYYADLPDPTTVPNQLYYVNNSSGIWMINRKSRGFYKSDGSEWLYAGELVEAFDEANFEVYSNTGSVKFSVPTTAQRTVTFPDRNLNLSEVNNGSVLLNLACTASVLVGDVVAIDSSGVLYRAQADATRSVIGICEEKTSLTTCHVRITGLTSPMYSGLVPGTRYFLSESSPGQLTDILPSGSGSVVYLIGVAVTEYSLNTTLEFIVIRS